MKIKTDDELQSYFVFDGMKNEDLRECFRRMDSVHNLNSEPMAIRQAGYEAARRSFVLGVRYAEQHNQAEVSALENLYKAFDAWYLESSHMCELHDKVKDGQATHDEVKQLELLNSLLNASISLQKFRPHPVTE